MDGTFSFSSPSALRATEEAWATNDCCKNTPSEPDLECFKLVCIISSIRMALIPAILVRRTLLSRRWAFWLEATCYPD